jgi:hypothetical protein
MAESYPERRKHFFDLAAAYRNAASMMEPQVTDGSTATSSRSAEALNLRPRRRRQLKQKRSVTN